MGLTLQGLPSGPMTIPDGNLGAGEAAVSSGIVRVKRMRKRELRLSRVRTTFNSLAPTHGFELNGLDERTT